MTPLFPAQRAAEEFDSVLGGRESTAVAERYAGLSATVQVLREQPEVMPRAAFVADLRERLMAAAETEMVPAAPVVRRLPSSREATARRNRRLGSAAAALVIVGGTAGMAAAASGALPGQALYPIKRGVEQVSIAAHFGDASQGKALLGQADERLDELQGLVADGSASPALVDATVSDFRTSADSGADKLFSAYRTDSDTADITAVRDFTSGAMAQVSSLSRGADPSLAGSLSETADVLADIDQQAVSLCSSCGGQAIAPPWALAADSGAATATNLFARPAEQAGKDVTSARAAQAALDKQRLDGLKDAAQGAADKLGSQSSGGSAGASTSQKLTSTLNSAGQLVPALPTAGKTAVNNLVGGLTSTLASTAGSLTGGGGGGSSGDLADTAKGAGSDLGKTLKGVTGSVGGTLKDLTKGQPGDSQNK